MKTKSSVFRMLLSFAFGIMAFHTNVAVASDEVMLYTAFTKISVPPGESISYSIEAINNSDVVQKLDLAVYGVPKTWSYDLKSGTYQVKQLAVLPGEKKTLSLKVDVPFKVNKGNHYIKVTGGGDISLPLVINVSEQGSFRTEFTSPQANMQGHARSTFSFNANLKNSAGEKQLYSLRSKPPQGWRTTFKANGKNVTSVEVEPNATTSISIDVVAPHTVAAGTYTIPVSAVTANTSAQLDLEIVITGTYELELTTATGLLSAKVTAGDEQRLELLLKNTGTSDLQNIKMNSTKPSGWGVTFDPEEVESIEAGKSVTVSTTINADKNAIAGDYVTNFTATTAEASSKAAFRISVKTPMIWGWIGILIILMASGIVYYLFRTYGRR